MSQLTYASDAGTSQAASSSPQPPSHPSSPQRPSHLSASPPPPPPSASASASNSSKDSIQSAGSVEAQLERLTTAVHENGHLIHVCTVLCEERCALALARDAQQAQRSESVQAQLARMLAMTQETLRREREVRVTADPEKYVLDLRRAAFGAGSTADSISRSSLMESAHVDKIRHFSTPSVSPATPPPPSSGPSNQDIIISVASIGGEHFERQTICPVAQHRSLPPASLTHTLKDLRLAALGVGVRSTVDSISQSSVTDNVSQAA
ncbi:hypothetical protein TRAPUB_12846 [Trametes pubescens]|uniref:Uncharacterized protein n=1 Tax=Trametes pubescens TaxID=154538 RepID=A0A1M2VT02_TRAPU|nr:hypothetical protein TRAPUB_12846 [Trametes pubescens]